jgi:hypothetical protein
LYIFNVSDFCNRVCAPDVLRRKFLDGVHYYFLMIVVTANSSHFYREKEEDA